MSRFIEAVKAAIVGNGINPRTPMRPPARPEVSSAPPSPPKGGSGGSMGRRRFIEAAAIQMLDRPNPGTPRSIALFASELWDHLQDTQPADKEGRPFLMEDMMASKLTADKIAPPPRR